MNGDLLMTGQENEDDLLMFSDESDSNNSLSSSNIKTKLKPWKIMIVDDDESIHQVTKLALNNVYFANRDITFISCYSGTEAQKAILEHTDTALILLDVVMETDHAGLDTARFIREEAKNSFVRIILRTGQPGQAPEREVITQYDINDYKEKTELTSTKLFTLLYSSLRSYTDIITIEENKRGLENVIEASANIFELTSLNKFSNAILEQLSSLLKISPGVVFLHNGGLTANCIENGYEIIGATGEFEDAIGKNANAVLEEHQLVLLDHALKNKQSSFMAECFLGYFESKLGKQSLVYISGIERLDEMDRSLIELFARNVSIAYENAHLHQNLEDTQREIAYRLGEAVETRSKETGNHVKRVAKISKLLALKYGLNDKEAEILHLASPLHDLGKIAIPDAILNKPGKLTEEEFEIMKTHAQVGYEMLQDSDRPILQAAAIVSHQHHERWNGKGYPQAKVGEDIHLYGRITAIVDVFDALASERCYKKAWPMDKVLKLLQEERGHHFEPKLVDLVFENLEEIEQIMHQYSDSFQPSDKTIAA